MIGVHSRAAGPSCRLPCSMLPYKLHARSNSLPEGLGTRTAQGPFCHSSLLVGCAGGLLQPVTPAEILTGVHMSFGTVAEALQRAATKGATTLQSCCDPARLAGCRGCARTCSATMALDLRVYRESAVVWRGAAGTKCGGRRHSGHSGGWGCGVAVGLLVKRV